LPILTNRLSSRGCEPPDDRTVLEEGVSLGELPWLERIPQPMRQARKQAWTWGKSWGKLTELGGVIAFKLLF
ncbi:MAG: hypothetical protein RI923_593, partial [Pseudomonadota bacterium]